MSLTATPPSLLPPQALVLEHLIEPSGCRGLFVLLVASDNGLDLAPGVVDAPLLLLLSQQVLQCGACERGCEEESGKKSEQDERLVRERMRG